MPVILTPPISKRATSTPTPSSTPTRDLHRRLHHIYQYTYCHTYARRLTVDDSGRILPLGDRGTPRSVELWPRRSTINRLKRSDITDLALFVNHHFVKHHATMCPRTESSFREFRVKMMNLPGRLNRTTNSHTLRRRFRFVRRRRCRLGRRLLCFGPFGVRLVRLPLVDRRSAGIKRRER